MVKNKRFIDWNLVTLDQADKWDAIQKKWFEQINKAFTIPKQQDIYDYFIANQGEIPQDPTDGKKLTGEPLANKYREFALDTNWVFKNFRKYCEEAVLFWTNKREFLSLQGEDDDYILGVFSGINNSPLPESTGTSQFEFGGDIYYAKKGINNIRFTQSKFWQLVDAMTIKASKLSGYEQLAYFAAIYYWRKGEKPNEKKVEARAKEFMSLDVVTALGVGFFLTSSMNGLALNMVKSLNRGVVTARRSKRVLTN